MKDYEQLIEFVINDEQDKAKELFHQIVVKESRKIYESLVSEDDLTELEQDTDVDSLSDEVVSDEEGLGGEEEMGDEFGGEEEMGDEFGDEEFGDEEEVAGEGDVEERVMDLEDAIDELRAEFEELMAGEEAEEENFPGIHDADGEDEGEDVSFDDESGEEVGADDEVDFEEEGDEEVKESNSIYERKQKSQQETMREYVEKVARISNAEGEAVGAAGTKVAPNAKSIVAGKNDMGGSAKNLVQGGSEANPDGTSATKKPSNYGTKGQTSVKDASNWENRPGAKAGSTFGKAQKPKSSEEAGVSKQSLEPGKN